MDTTLAPTAALPAPASAPRLPPALDRLLALPARTKMGLGLAILALTALIALAVSMGNTTQWRVLYANLADKDGGTVIAALTQMNVPHRIAEGGGAILVPESQVHAVRLKLASQGLPRGGAVGFELMENQKFGTTQFQERLNFQRGLEGELARSIMALAAVQSARVHLALPQQTAFLREQQKPSASVLLTLHGGRTLDRSQIAGIVHLVASSVPELHPKAVSVLDQTGALLSQDGADAPNGLDAAQLRHVRQTEQSLAARILSIVEPIVGPGNVKAQVTADLDFTQSESTAEMYAPNQGANLPQSVRSQHLSETPGSGVAPAGGIPGALANQPPATPTSPVNGAPQALTPGPQAGAAVGGAKRDAVTNYEVDKTVRVTRAASGNVRRLNAAVVVNHAADAKGAAQALTPEQMEQINALVREAIGFNKERGDSVNVVNAPFRVAGTPAVAELPLWKQPEVIELARSLAPWVALPLVALIVILGLVRPALRASRASAVDGNGAPRLLDTTVHDAVPLPNPDGSKVSVHLPDTAGGLPGAVDPSVPLLPSAQSAAQHARNAQLENIRQLARSNPATVANVVRNWVTTPN